MARREGWPAGGRPGAGPLGRLWMAFFAYGTAAGLLVQLVLLPHVFPAWHGAEGLLAGGDWLTFHYYGAALAERIRQQGWSAFELRPGGDYSPAGVAGAVYALTVSRPWTLVPLNAALHATAGILLLRLVQLFLPDWRQALVCVLPFVVYPTALTWVAQIHKEGFFIAGYLCLLYGWARLARDEPAASGRATTAGALALLPAGFVLLWVMRPQHVRMFQVFGAALAVVVAGAVLGRAVRARRRRLRAVTVAALVVAATLLPGWLLVPDGRGLASPGGGPRVAREPGERPAATPPGQDPFALRRGVSAIAWYRSTWLPTSVDRVAYRLALVREQFLVYYLDARSNVDVPVTFHSVGAIARYLPRAALIGLWAPFPAGWVGAGTEAWGGPLRRVVGAEMLGVYLATAGLPLAVWRWRRRPELWVVLLGCFLPLTVYALAVPNVGALHRFRYGFLTTLVAVGLAGWWGWWAGRTRARAAGRARPGDDPGSGRGG